MIAFTMDCFDQVLLLPEQIEDLDITWDNADVLPVLVKRIAHREGIGGLLAEGVRTAARKIGQDIEELAIHVKGLESPPHDTCSGRALGVTYETSNRGMCHIHPIVGMAWDCGKLV